MGNMAIVEYIRVTKRKDNFSYRVAKAFYIEPWFIQRHMNYGYN